MSHYRAAYDQHGTSPFAPDELDWNHLADERDHIVDLAVAYGLFETDGDVYHVTCGPDDADCWDTLVADRADRIRRSIATHDAVESDDTGRQSFSYDGGEYAAVSVARGADFATVAQAVSAVELDRWNGVALCAPGDYANEVQQFAERLADPSGLTDVSLSTPLQKEYSDVEGSSKDTLEFRLFLSRP
jgi:hypothetical protein